MIQRIPRRDFLKSSLALAMGGGALQAGAVRAGQAAASTADAKLEWRDSLGGCHSEPLWTWDLPIDVKVANVVVPAKAGTHVRWIPAFAGMT